MAVDLSIIVPAYNAEKTILRLFKSIEPLEKQTDITYEVVVVNDGSKDATRSIVVSYAEKHPGIVLLNQDNGGVSSARNEAIKNAKGQWLFFADADDEIISENLIPLVNRIKPSNSIAVAIANYNTVDLQEGKKVLCQIDGPKDTLVDEDYIRNNILRSIFCKTGIGLANIWNKVYQRNFILDNQIFFDTHWTHGEDWKFNITCFRLAKKCFLSSVTIYNYFLDGSQNYAKYSKDLGKSFIEGYKELLELNKTYAFYSEDSVEYKKLMGRFFKQSIKYLSLDECNKKEKKAYLHTEEQKQLYRYLLKLKRNELTEIGYSRRNKLVFFLLRCGVINPTIKIYKSFT